MWLYNNSKEATWWIRWQLEVRMLILTGKLTRTERQTIMVLKLE